MKTQELFSVLLLAQQGPPSVTTSRWTISRWTRSTALAPRCVYDAVGRWIQNYWIAKTGSGRRTLKRRDYYVDTKPRTRTRCPSGWASRWLTPSPGVAPDSSRSHRSASTCWSAPRSSVPPQLQLAQQPQRLAVRLHRECCIRRHVTSLRYCLSESLSLFVCVHQE